MRALVTIALLTAACSEPPPPVEGPPPPPVEARSRVDKAVATTGDVINYEVIIEHDKNVEITFPDPSTEIAGFRMTDLGTDAPETVGERIIERRWFELRADLVGTYILPPVRVAYREKTEDGKSLEEAVSEAVATAVRAAKAEAEAAGEDAEKPDPQAIIDGALAQAGVEVLSTSEIFVEVASVLPADGSAEDIRDIKPLELIEEPPVWPWVAGGVGALLLFGLLAWLFNRKREEVVIPPVPAHELAFAALNNLRSTDFEDPEAVRRYYFQISEVLRAYVEGRFGLNATDLTTREILDRLDEAPELPAASRDKLETFLIDTDQVKFASYQPSSAEIGETYERALSFVEETVPRPVMQEAA